VGAGRMTELLIIYKRDAEHGRAAFAARCHAGQLHLMDAVTLAIDPAGIQHQICARCTEIRLSERIMVDELEANYGGLIILEGSDVAMLDVGWIVRTE
jgi:hypothetical protein